VDPGHFATVLMTVRTKGRVPAYAWAMWSITCVNYRTASILEEHATAYSRSTVSFTMII